jgi:sialate O-acetylesterase
MIVLFLKKKRLIMIRNIHILLCVVCIACTSAAQVSVPGFFGNNMVLQRHSAIPVWGWAKPNEPVVVKFNGQVKNTRADKTGKWMIRLAAEQAGGPHILTIQGKNTIDINNVLVGDVWLCTGQWRVGQSNNAIQEANTANYPFIRQIKIAHTVNTLPTSNIADADWQVCSPATAANFSGVGYFFARMMYDSTKVPVGLINTCWGGTNIETWISREGFENSNEFATMIAGIPRISLDSMSTLADKGLSKKIESLQQNKLPLTDTLLFKATSFDDSRWPLMNVPQLWEGQSVGELDGVVWMRKTVYLSEQDVNGKAVLMAGKIDDDDITYVNGTKVGSTNKWDEPRRYTIVNGILKPGKNIIAVRIVDHGALVLPNRTIPLSGQWHFQVESVIKTPNQNGLPSLCYNAMIAPLVPYAFKGVLWYQGESNAARAYQYRKAFPLLISDWRNKFAQGNFPFYFVQLASFTTNGNSNAGCDWAELREAQTMTLTQPNTGMVVTTDLVTDPKDIHPTNKQDVGKRLAGIALHNLYGKPVVCNGPAYTSMEIKGSDIIVSFNDTGTGLHTPDKYGYVKGFEIAGADKVFYFARATIKGHSIIVSSSDVPYPVAVRFGWMGDATECNLFNKEGLPAVPFRTDDWHTVTRQARYTCEKLQ